MKNKAKPEKYRLPTSKGDQVNKPATISKGVLKETVHTRPKIKTQQSTQWMIRSLFPEGPDPAKAIKQGTLSKIHLNQFHKGPD